MDDFRKAFHRNFQLRRVELVAKQQHFHAPDLLFKSTEQKKKEQKEKTKRKEKKRKEKEKKTTKGNNNVLFHSICPVGGLARLNQQVGDFL
jgi:hypothetical protein